MADLNGLPSLSATWQRLAEEALAELAVARTWNAWSNEGDVSLGWMRIDYSNWKILEGIYLDANSYTFQYIPIHSNSSGHLNILEWMIYLDAQKNWNVLE